LTRIKFPSNPFNNDRMEPLEIEFKLGAPVMLSYPWIMLDSLVAHAVLEQHFPDVLASLDGRVVVDLSELPMPLEKHRFTSNGKEDFLYRGSCSRFSPSKTATVNIRKRLCEPDTRYLASTRKVDIVRGPFKAYGMKMITIAAPSCKFWCVGARRPLEELLAGVSGLGKKRAAGCGRIIGVSIVEAEQDASMLHPDHGVNRPVPVSLAKQLDLPGASESIAMLAYKPPYWNKSKHALCRVPDGF